MYSVSFYIANYYNWWLRRTKSHPRIWLFGLLLLNFLPFVFGFSVDVIPKMAVYLVVGVLVAPAFFAAAANDRAATEKRDVAWRAIVRVQKMIERGRKR